MLVAAAAGCMSDASTSITTVVAAGSDEYNVRHSRMGLEDAVHMMVSHTLCDESFGGFGSAKYYFWTVVLLS
jgi:hypothetical protein